MWRRQNGRHFADDIFKYIFYNQNLYIFISISSATTATSIELGNLSYIHVYEWEGGQKVEQAHHTSVPSDCVSRSFPTSGMVNSVIWQQLWQQLKWNHWRQDGLRERKHPPCLVWGAWTSLAMCETVYTFALNMMSIVPCIVVELSWKFCHRYHHWCDSVTPTESIVTFVITSRWPRKLFTRFIAVSGRVQMPNQLRSLLDKMEWSTKYHGSFASQFTLKTGRIEIVKFIVTARYVIRSCVRSKAIVNHN